MTNMTESEFNAATVPPRHTDIPSCFTPPDDLKRAIKTRDAAYDAWVEIEDASVAAWLAVDQTVEADRQALVEAVAANKPDPGTDATQVAERTLVVALERVRQARRTADIADQKVSRAYKEHMPDFVPQATAHARARMDAYLEQLERAKAIVADARNELRDAYDGLAAIRDYVAPVMLYTPPSTIPDIHWNDDHWRHIFAHARDLCGRIEGRILYSGLDDDALKAKLNRGQTA